MIDHLSIGVADLARAKRFYDAVFAPLGVKCTYNDETSLGYGKSQAVFWVLKVASPVIPDVRSGLHVCLEAGSAEAVDAFYRAALAHGGADNGTPGIRKNYSADYYAAFVTDPDGYRLEAHVTHPA